jgi:hypothetical protein
VKILSARFAFGQSALYVFQHVFIGSGKAWTPALFREIIAT